MHQQQLCNISQCQRGFRVKNIWLIGAFAVLALVAACSSVDSTDGGNGALSLSLTDAATEQYAAVYVTIDAIQVHLGGNGNKWKWVTMSTSPMTVDLLKLVNGIRKDLGTVALPSGHYTQMRLIIGQTPDNELNLHDNRHPHANYVIDQNDSSIIHELKIPSGENTGVKIVRGFDINANFTTELILDFNAHSSVVQAGASGNWLLKPTIRVVELTESAIIEGTVTLKSEEAAPGTGIAGAMVSVQRYNAAAANPMDQVTVEAATVTDKDGNYQLLVSPGNYLLVVCAAGKQPAFKEINVLSYLEQDHELTTVAEGQLYGNVNIFGATTEQYATLSFRKTVGLGTDEKRIEIKSINALNGTGYSTSLPVDAAGYSVVASAFDYPSKRYTGIIIAEGEQALHFSIDK